MEITRRDRGRTLEIRVEGRLDAYWADHLSEEISSAIREGRHSIALDLSGLSYISSAGIRVLMRFRKQLKTLDGALSVIRPSNAVREILKLMKLGELFTVPPPAEEGRAAKEAGERRLMELPSASFEAYAGEAGASLICRVIGDPDALTRGGFGEKDCRSLSLSPRGFAVGLGALGSSFTDCQARFGEFIAVGGAVAYLPTDKGNVPDYLISAENVSSGLQVLYCLSCEGGFSHIINFEAKRDLTVSLLDLASQCLEIAGGNAAGMVMAAEVDGLVGAALKRSPILAAPGSGPFRHPEIRDWMTFTAEPAYGRGVALVAGVAAKRDDAGLGPMIRPLGGADWPRGHFHGAVFSYRPLKKGRAELAGAVRALFEEEILQGILHLLTDARPIAGAGQSEFVRGACWVAPISSVVSERE